jgi:hypothetical protein
VVVSTAQINCSSSQKEGEILGGLLGQLIVLVKFKCIPAVLYVYVCVYVSVHVHVSVRECVCEYERECMFVCGGA